MPLTIKGNVLVDAPREEVWKLLFDAAMLKQVANKVPGVTVERLEQVSPDKYEGSVTIGVAAIKGTYDGALTVLESRAPEYALLRGEGKGGGNWTSGEVAVTLTAQDDRTLMDYAGKGNLSGKLASVGQRLVDTVGRQFVDQGARALADEIAARRREMAGIAPAPKPVPARPDASEWVYRSAAVAFGVLIAVLVYRLLSR